MKSTREIDDDFIEGRQLKGFIADLHGGGGRPETTKLSHFNATSFGDISEERFNQNNVNVCIIFLIKLGSVPNTENEF